MLRRVKVCVNPSYLFLLDIEIRGVGSGRDAGRIRTCVPVSRFYKCVVSSCTTQCADFFVIFYFSFQRKMWCLLWLCYIHWCRWQRFDNVSCKVQNPFSAGAWQEQQCKIHFSIFCVDIDYTNFNMLHVLKKHILIKYMLT